MKAAMVRGKSHSAKPKRSAYPSFINAVHYKNILKQFCRLLNLSPIKVCGQISAGLNRYALQQLLFLDPLQAR